MQELIVGKLDRLESNREVAHFAATLGREFQYELLAAVVNVDEQTLQRELAKLSAAEILFSKGSPPRCAYLFKHALLEEALHNALEETERRRFHRQVAEVMEARFPESTEKQPELLALHFTEAGDVERAVGYWLKAGRRSHERFAIVEAISHLTKGLAMLRTLEETSHRNGLELEILGLLGTAYIASRGYAAPEVEPIFDRARMLTRSGGATPQTFTMMRGHFAYHIVRGNFRLCTELAAEAMQFARQLDDPGILMEALFLEGLTRLYCGDFIGAHASCAQALADFDDRARTAYWATQTGEDSGVAHRCYLALASWHLGLPNRALALDSEARELARTLNHPFSLEYALHHSAWLHQHCRLAAPVRAAAQEMMRIADDQGFQFWHATGTLYSGAGFLLRVRLEEGLQSLQNGLAAYRATGACLGLPYYLGILAEALTLAGRLEEAGATLAEAFEIVERNDERFQEAELHRLHGDLHVAHDNDRAAEQCFRRALEIAQAQGSLAWNLRATVSLATLWARTGRSREALGALTAVYEVFTEGHETADLVAAAGLLKELGNQRMRDDLAAGIKYVRGCIPPPIREGPVLVDWRYIPASTLGGDTLGYHWVDPEHLAMYLIDVTGHGLDSALLAVTITNVIRSGSLAGADLRHPDQVLGALNQAFQGAQHGHKYFTIWYGVYHLGSRTLAYASGGHPAAVAIVPGEPKPRLLPASGSVMGIAPGMRFPAASSTIPVGSRLYVFSDGVFEVRRNKETVSTLDDCAAQLFQLGLDAEDPLSSLLYRVRDLHGSPQLDDDFSVMDIRFSSPEIVR